MDTKLIDEAKETISTIKVEEYGKAKDNFERIVKYWNVYLRNKGIDIKLEPSDIALMMILFKIARLQNRYKEDSVIDIIGYSQLYSSLEEDKDE